MQIAELGMGMLQLPSDTVWQTQVCRRTAAPTLAWRVACVIDANIAILRDLKVAATSHFLIVTGLCVGSLSVGIDEGSIA